MFEGHDSCYGSYKLTGEVKDNGKRIGKAATHSKPVSVELYHDHLLGLTGLGITPINKDSKVKFGAIDIDEYPLDLEFLNEQIQEQQLPVILCRTKSGGAHLYMFLKDWTTAGLVQKKLREIAGSLGYGTCEIYPRQAQILAERGDSGNWINLPYFAETKTMRYALGPKGKALSLKDFIIYADSKRIAEVDLNALRFAAPEELRGGPPCLQTLIKQGFPEGCRNNGLMSLGVYAMKAHGDEWQKKLEEYNLKFMKPPLGTEEVLGVIKSLSRKDYNYSCKSQPLQSFCNAAVCRTCLHGVGGADLGMPKFGTLTKLTTVPPVWFLDVETEDGCRRMELTTEELQQPTFFQRRCMDTLNTMPMILKRDNWMQIVQKLLADVTVIEVPPEATPVGQMLQHLESFCMSKVTARAADEMLLGKPWHNNEEVHFRLQDFLGYLSIKKYNMLPLHKIAVTLKELEGCYKKFHNLKGKGINVYVVPKKTFQVQTESFDTPEQPPEVI